MKKGTLAIWAGLAVLLLVLGWAIFTRPPIEESPRADAPSLPPLEHHLLLHMRDDDGIDFGPTTAHDVAVIEENGGIRIVFSGKILEKWGPEAAIRLRLIDRETSIRRDQFERFLRNLHEIIVEFEKLEHYDHHP